jgi:serine protease Do
MDNNNMDNNMDYGMYHMNSEPVYEYQDTSEVFPEPEPPKKPKKGMAKKVTALVMSGLLFGGVAGGTFVGTNYIGSRFYQNNVTETNSTETKTGNKAQTVSNVNTGTNTGLSGITDVSEVAANVMPSIVAITNKSVQEVQSMFGTMQQDAESSGSGIIVGENDTELLIATNNHVVDGADTLTVSFFDDSAIEAKVKGQDPSNDLAVIAVNLKDIPDETMSAIKVAELGDSDALAVGQQVVAIGNALGYGQSVTTGIVSALNRETGVENMVSELIQTDAAINPGNSGGALLNTTGQVIGINSVKFAASGVEGMGYAIPISTAKPIIENLMNQTTREKLAEEDRGYLGVVVNDVTSEVSEMYGMPIGIYVAQVSEGLAADEAGIQKGDIITKLDGIVVTSRTDLKNKLQYYGAGETVTITVSVKTADGYEEKDIEVTLQSQASADVDNEQESQFPGMENGMR